MKRKSLLLQISSRLLLGAFFAIAVQAATAAETALDRYIAKPDPVFEWKLVKTIPGEGYKVFMLEMTSQTWRSAAEVDRPVWKHGLTIVKPESPRPGTGFLFIGGGNINRLLPENPPQRVVDLALGSNTVVAELGQVPNQPLVFTDNKDARRSEDDLIAYSRIKYIETKDEEWLVRLAMVKSGVRALDAMSQFMATPEGGNVKLDKFVVAGGSKRGWTTWLVGVEDPRVIAIAPMVIDALNSQEITRHHYEAYGFFSTALNDYVRHKIFPDKVGTPEYREVLQIEDPYNYRKRDRLKIPKYLVNASGDQFFLPDNSQFYFDDMPEPKYLRYVENAKHNLEGSDARESVLSFYQTILDGKPLPKFSWKKKKDGSITVKVDDKPKEVHLWQATNANARDFRLDIIGKAWTSKPLEESKPGVYEGKIDKPEKGFSAFFVQLVYENGSKFPLKFTTEVSVVPDILPFKMPKTLTDEERAKMVGRRGED